MQTCAWDVNFARQIAGCDYDNARLRQLAEVEWQFIHYAVNNKVAQKGITLCAEYAS